MVYVFLADGFEEIEAVTPIDILLRAGLTVKTVAVGANPVTGAHGIPVTADIDIGAVCLDEAELIVLPGGMPGTKTSKAATLYAPLYAVHMKNIFPLGQSAPRRPFWGIWGYWQEKTPRASPALRTRWRVHL